MICRLLALLATAALGCATPVYVELSKAGGEQTLGKVALAPFSVGIPLAEANVDGVSPEMAASIVTRHVLEALALESDLEVVPPEDVRRALLARGPIEMPPTPEAIGARLRESFAVDGVLYGTVQRFVPRHGTDRGVTRPAGVWFDLELRAPDGTLLWKGTYDEIQQGVSDDVLSLGRARQRGFRWVSAEELAAYGARELVRRMPHRSR